MLSILNGIRTSESDPKYRTSLTSLESIRKSSVTEKNGFPGSTSMRQRGEAGKLAPVMTSTDRGTKSDFIDQQPQKAFDLICRSREPASKVAVSSGEGVKQLPEKQ
jgi:hypothetical protein